MCGIAGILHFSERSDALRRVKAMATAIVHRGPDDEGFWSDPDVALGFRRLAIVDIETGAQPLSNEDGTVWVVYNGEIYNHREMRRELEGRGHRFQTDHCDTEVIVHGWEQWGMDMPEKLNGMFAFALWDRNRRQLILARDRLGIKPLYVASADSGDDRTCLCFCSEVRGIHASGLLQKRMDPSGVKEYLTLNNNWFGRTPFAGVRMVQPGTIESYGLDGPKTRRFWSMRFHRSNHLALEPSVEAYREMLLQVMRRQMDADVPVMSYLSGGIDSTAITVAAHRLDRQVRAYSCLFDLRNVGEDRFVDEREFSGAVAAATGIEHTTLLIEQDALIETLDATIAALEYPRMGMAYVNYLIAGRVAETAKVVLSGMGGDEFHAGYVGRYTVTPRGAPERGLRSFFRSLLRSGRAGRGLDAYRNCLNFPIPSGELDEALTPEFGRAAAAFNPTDAIADLVKAAPSADPWDTVMYGDCLTYLHGLLVLEDKLSMAHSLETRVPLLDNEVIDNALHLPWPFLCDGTTGKIIFREAVKPWVPEQIYAKPKMGFAPPDASWYRNTLREWISDQLSIANIQKRGILNPEYVQRKLAEHFSGSFNHVVLLWSFLSLESWCRVHDISGP